MSNPFWPPVNDTWLLPIVAPLIVQWTWMLGAYRRDRAKRERERITDGLHARLMEYARRLRLPVTVHDRLTSGSAPALKPGETIAGQYVGSIRGLEIRLARFAATCPITLAHELGHHEAITKFDDLSEDAADREGLAIIRRVLTADDWSAVMDEPQIARMRGRRG